LTERLCAGRNGRREVHSLLSDTAVQQKHFVELDAKVASASTGHRTAAAKNGVQRSMRS
jgi:hypothetical protein